MLRIVQPAASDPVTLDEVKAYLRVVGDFDDAVLISIVAGVASRLAGASGWLGRSLCDQTFELTVVPEFYSVPAAIVLPCPPVLSVESVSVARDDAFTLLDASAWRLVVGSDGLPRVRLASPPTCDAIRILYQAGYGTTADPATPIDPGLKAAILMMVGRIFQDREGESSMDPVTAREIFGPYRVFLPPCLIEDCRR